MAKWTEPREFKEQIIIQSKTTTQGSDGAQVEVWSNFATVRAKVRIQNGREFWAAQKNNAELSGLINIRYISGVTELMRVSYNSIVYQIIIVINVEEANRELELHVKKVS
jgi:SPP1 family predicted phage head-tail adaptor